LEELAAAEEKQRPPPQKRAGEEYQELKRLIEQLMCSIYLCVVKTSAPLKIRLSGAMCEHNKVENNRSILSSLIGGDLPTKRIWGIEHGAATTYQRTCQMLGAGTHTHGLRGSDAELLPRQLEKDCDSF
jgi:hypothetical protein